MTLAVADPSQAVFVEMAQLAKLRRFVEPCEG
jgi:hypothetical protein